MRSELNILFTCAGRRVELLDAFRGALAQLGMPGKIIAADITTASPAVLKADKSLLLPSAGRIEYIPTLLQYVKDHDVALVVPVTDLDIRSLARQRHRFEEVGCTVMVGTERVINACREKGRINEILRSAGMSPIETLPLAEFFQRPFYPCFVKPARGSGSVGTGVVHSDRELQAHVKTFGEMLIVQEYVNGQEFTIDVYRSRDGVVRSVVPRQRLAVRSGEVEKGITVNDAELIDAGVRIGSMLDEIWGVFCCQCRRAEGDPPKFFEVNPRFGGGVLLSVAAGANMPLYLLQEVLGLPITAELGKFTDRLLMLRYDAAVYTPVEDPSSLPGYESPRFR